MPASRSTGRSYRALPGDRTLDVVVDGQALSIDGRAVQAALEPLAEGTFVLRLDDRSMPVTVEPLGNGRLRLTLRGRRIDVRVLDERALLMERFGMALPEAAATREVHAPMPGLVLAVAVVPGQAVRPGDSLVVLEAMKMENDLRAETAGVVRAVHVTPGAAVSKNTLLIEFEA